ncbi:guanine-N2--methyltransferase [Nadsonia fulvescens var. elongata DSM 6958]|uniref:tRNA (guanine(26)-N(2))-dimethyltransferase n=1 Tax=Nadsonia fulvescens var. elongata DSM 6958 TaxID=857566 RepID=A0A1E3PLC4_9ASCO|nr:guanine-N2--methyltransferase [Nadsonia fulvescens var. elongata DSM 6958]
MDKYSTFTEGKAEILFPKENQVFYNPIQQYNRDLSVTCIRAWHQLYSEKKSAKKLAAKNNAKKRKIDQATTQENTNQQTEKVDENKEISLVPINILEALSASGLRAIRYAKEIPQVKTILANDFDPAAVKTIERNVKHNGVENIVKPSTGDANAVMYASKASSIPFHVIDLDPYGTAAPFVDAAVQSVVDDGLLLVTCTDLGVLAGNGYPEKCFSLYGGNNIPGEYVHETALRLVLHMLATTAAKYGRSVEPLLSLSIDFYVRVFVRVRTSPAAVKHLASTTMSVYACSGCGAYHTQPIGRATKRDNGSFKFSTAQISPGASPNCIYCGFTNHLGGPMWAGPLHNPEFLDKVLQIRDTLDEKTYGTLERIKGMVTIASQELPDAPFYISPPAMSSVCKTPCPPQRDFVAAIFNAGYELSYTHANPGALKTNAPWNALWDIFRSWIKFREHKPKRNPNAASEKLLEPLDAEPEVMTAEEKSRLEKLFASSEKSEDFLKLRKAKIVRYQMNPQKNWGPKAKAGGESDKKKKNPKSNKSDNPAQEGPAQLETSDIKA